MKSGEELQLCELRVGVLGGLTMLTQESVDSRDPPWHNTLSLPSSSLPHLLADGDVKTVIMLFRISQLSGVNIS